MHVLNQIKWVFGNDGSDMLVMLVAIILLVLFFYVGRIFFRASVDRRVKSINASMLGFMSLDEMRKRGLISAREHKEMRSKMAHRALQEQKEAEKGATVASLAVADIDPAIARKLVADAKPDDLVKASLAGLGRPHADPEEGWRELEKIRDRDRTGPRIGAAALEAQRAKEDAEKVAAQLAHQLLGAPAPPEDASEEVPASRPSREQPRPPRELDDQVEIEGLDESDPWRITRPAPAQSPPAPNSIPPKATPIKSPPRAPIPSKAELLADPIFAKQAAREAAERKKKTKDIDQLYAKGLITKEEYDRLAALFDKA